LIKVPGRTCLHRSGALYDDIRTVPKDLEVTDGRLEVVRSLQTQDNLAALLDKRLQQKGCPPEQFARLGLDPASIATG
jgi:hypothetical protein